MENISSNNYRLPLLTKIKFNPLNIIIAFSYALLVYLITHTFLAFSWFLWDIPDYLWQAHLTPLNIAFYPVATISDFSNIPLPAFFRPFIYPLLLKFVSTITRGLHDSYYMYLYQKIFYVISTLTFSIIFAQLIPHKKYRVVFLSLLLIFFLSPQWLQWINMLYTESFALCFYLLLLACLLLQFHKSYQHWALSLMTLIVMFAFAGIRDTNIYILFLTTILVLITGFINKQPSYKKRLSILYFVAALFIIGFCQLSILTEHRQLATLIDSIDNRLACQQDLSLLKTYERYGMPQQNFDKTRASQIYVFHGRQDIAKNNPTLNRWLFSTDSSHAYAHYLLTHPYYTFIMPFNRRLIENEYNQCQRYKNHRDLATSIPQAFSANYIRIHYVKNNAIKEIIFAAKIITPIPFVLFLLSLLLTLIFKRRYFKKNLHFLVGLASIGSSSIALLICWHGEVLEVPRHSLIPILQFYLACFYCSMALFNKYLAEKEIH